MPKVYAQATSQDDASQPDPLGQANAPGAEAGAQSDPGAQFAADHAARTAQVNEAWVKNTQASWLDGMNTLLYHPDSGYLNQSGGLAVGSYGGLQKAMGDLYQQNIGNLADDNQRGMFERTTAPLLEAFQAQIRQHADNQYRIFDSDASHNRFQSALNLAVNAYNPGAAADNTLYRNSAAIAHNELENSCPDKDNKALLEHYLRFGPNGDGGMCSIYTGVTNRLLENNQPDDARAYFDSIKHDLPPSTRDKLDQFIQTGADHQQGLDAALQAQAQGNELEQQQHALLTMRNNGKITPHAYDIALQQVQANNDQKLAVQKQNDGQSLSSVWNLKNNNPNPAITDLPASTWAYLKSRGLDEKAIAILNGHPATDDPALFNQLHRLASEDPVKFAQTSLIASSGQLSKAHMDYLQGLQDAVNKQDPQAIQASKQVNDAVATVQAEMKLSGLNPNPEPGSAQEKQLAQVESNLRDQIIAAQQAKNGTPLTRDEVQNLAMGYFADQVLKSGLFSKNGDGKQPQVQDGQNKDQGAPQEGKDAQNAGGPKFPQFNPAETLPNGAPVAASSMADQRGGEAKVAAPNLAVGDKKPHGVIAEGATPESRIYVVKSKEGGADLQAIADELGVDFDQMKELNKFSREKGGWQKNGMKLQLPSQQAEREADSDHVPVVDIDAMTKEINRIANPSAKEGCRKNVFNAIDVGLEKAGKSIRIDRNTPNHYAEEAEPSLEKVGFKKIVSSADGLAAYTPRRGDVVVLHHYEGQGYYKKTKDKDGKDTKEWVDLPAGHIAIFDGKYWVSDFVQKRGSRIWGGADRQHQE